MGALIVVGDGPDVLNLCSGGFLANFVLVPVIWMVGRQLGEFLVVALEEALSGGDGLLEGIPAGFGVHQDDARSVIALRIAHRPPGAAVFEADVKATLRRVEDNTKASNENFRDLFPKLDVIFEVLYDVAAVSLAAAEMASDLSPSMLLGHAGRIKDLVRRHLTGKTEGLASEEVGP